MVAPVGGFVLDASETLSIRSPRMTMTAGAAGACAKLAATNAMVEIAASMYRIRTSWELGGHHTSGKAKTENWELRTRNCFGKKKQFSVPGYQFSVFTTNPVFLLISLPPPRPRPQFRPAFLVKSAR